jgi:hypothetical protein
MRQHKFDLNIAAPDQCLVCGRSRAWVSDNPGPCAGTQQQRERMLIDEPDSPKDPQLPPHRPRRWRGDT